MKSVTHLRWLAVCLLIGSIISASIAGATTNDLFVALFLGGIVCGCASDIVAAVVERRPLSDPEGKAR